MGERIIKRSKTTHITEGKNGKCVWTKKEDQLLLDAAKKYAGNWLKVSERVQTKDADECFERANEIIAPQSAA